MKGDINGDGRINVSDVGLANAHAKKVSTLEGYQFDCANVNGDARITISDVGLLNAHAKKTSLLMHLWIILLCVSGLGVIATTVLGKKRFVK